ncbi:MAG: hypothetical protein C4516_02030 [Oxalobacter sp.]|nr:MAG: hypothetical protein C4516_02030 [Oxalobacter sp.]
MPDLLQKYSELRSEKGYAYMRWLMLISTGAFSVSVSVLFGKTFSPQSLIVLKAALSANAIGVLFGAIAIFGEAMLPRGVVRLLVDKEIHKMRRDYEAAANVPSMYTLPPCMKYIERLFYLALCTSLGLWVWFIWLQ